jgi:hypothetical protein
MSRGLGERVSTEVITRRLRTSMTALWSALRKNPGLKFVSFVLAVAIWAYIAGSEDSSLILVLPVNFVNLSPDLVLVDSSTDTVRVTLIGPKSTLSNLRLNDLSKVQVDLSTIRAAGKEPVALDPARLNLVNEPRTRVSRISPNLIEVTVEQLARKLVPINLRTKGEVQTGFVLERLELRRRQAEIQGPTSALNKVEAVDTQVVDLEDRTKSFSELVTLVLEESNARFSGSPSVVVEATIRERIITREFANLPINYPPGVEEQTETCAVTLKGPMLTLEALSELDVPVYLPDGPYDSLRPRLPLLVPDLPPEVEMVSIRPRELRVKVAPTPTPLPTSTATPAPQPTPEQTKTPYPAAETAE